MQPAASAQAKVTLAETVFAGKELVEVAQAVLRWLGEHAGVESGVCAVVDPEGKQLRGIAGDGVPHARVVDWATDLAHRDDPLIVAIDSPEPIWFGGRRGAAHPYPRTPLGDVPFVTVPLKRPEAGASSPLGVLLLTGTEHAPNDDIRWASTLLANRVLGERYASLRSDVQRLDRERSRLRSVVNAVTDPILLSDAEGRMLVSNAHAEALLAASEAVSEGRRRAISLNNMLFSAALFTATEQDLRTRREVLLVDPIEGRDLLFELMTTAVPDSSGSPTIVSVLRNVNDLRSATEQIEEQYRKLQIAEAEARAERDRRDLIINAVADPVLATDPSGSIVLMNPPAERLFTTGPGPANPTLERHVQANDVVFSSFISNLHTAQALRWRGELTLVEPGTGRKLPFEAIAGKVISPRGEDTATVTILHDRSEALEKARLYEQVKQHSEELRQKVGDATAELMQQNVVLRQQALALEQASQEKSRFLANISHELRTPLNAVLGYTELLRKGVFGPLSTKQLDKLERIDGNSRHLLTIINDLLDISRIESGGMPTKVETFQLGDVLKEVMQQLEPIMARSPVTVTLEQGPSMPTVHNDRQKIKQIALNLLSNALKFTPEGFVHVTTGYLDDCDELCIGVADTGIGIPEDQQEKIFEEFYQVDDSSSRRHSGTGLGLAICRQLADYVGGRITLNSHPGAGSTFKLIFARHLDPA